MTCCLCGQKIRQGQFAVVIRAFVRLKDSCDRIVLEDGSDEKIAHYMCPVNFGAPMALFGFGLPYV